MTKESHYNAQNVLTDETEYVYDAAGKRIATVTALGQQTYNYTSGYQLDSVTGTNAQDYDYDVDGRMDLMQRDGQTLDLDHDVYDRLTSVKNVTTNATTNYVYDGQGRRITATTGSDTRMFLVAPVMGGGLDSTDMMTDGAGNMLSNYVYAGGSSPFMRIDANGNPVYYLTDGMGSVIGLADGAGQGTAKFGYDSFGNVRTSQGAGVDSSGGDFRFQGQWLESATGIYHFRARDYDSRTGTFLSRDPVDPNTQEPEALNPYQAMYNNPYVYSDPTGMFSISELGTTQQVQSILMNYARQEAVGFLKQKTGEIFGNVALGIINQLVPGASVGEALFDLTDQGYVGNVGGGGGTSGIFEDFIRDNICSLLPTALSNRLWLGPEVSSDGTVGKPGFNCKDFTTKVKYKASNPEFLFAEGSPAPAKPKNAQSYLIGDVKITAKAAWGDVTKPDNQWLAMANHASKYQALPLVSYITFRWNPTGGRAQGPFVAQNYLKDMQQEALEKGVLLFLAVLFDEG